MWWWGDGSSWEVFQRWGFWFMLTPSRVHLCSISLGEQDDCRRHGDLERMGARRCSKPRSTCKYWHSSQQNLHHLGGWMHWAAHVFVPYQVPSEQKLEKTVPSWAAIQWCLVLPAHLWCQWERCRLRKGGLRNGWALRGHCWAPSRLLLAQIWEAQ